MKISYAQQFEDIMLWRALKGVNKGTYIDIGANDPVIDSVSLLFYQNGWRGMHVEPMPDCATKLREARPDEDVLEIAVGGDTEELTLFSFEGTGLTTAIAEHANQHQEGGREAELIKVPCLPLSDIFEQANRRDVHWLKIDVEGMEKTVLESWGDNSIRPWIVVVESTLPNSQIPAHEYWEEELIARDYEFVYFDGLNRFYVHARHADLKDAFSTPPNFFDRFFLSEHSPFSGHVSGKWYEARAAAERLERELEKLQTQHQVVDDARLHLEQHVAAIEAKLTESHEAESQARSLAKSIQMTLQSSENIRDQLSNERDALKASLEDLQVRFEMAERDIQTYHADIAALQNGLSVWRADALAYRDKSEEILSSASWKLSAPIRWVGMALRRGRQIIKGALRPVFGAALKIVRSMPWIKRPILAIANLAPPVRRKIDHFVSVRAPERPLNEIVRENSWNIEPSPDVAQEWHTLLKTEISDWSRPN